MKTTQKSTRVFAGKTCTQCKQKKHACYDQNETDFVRYQNQNIINANLNQNNAVKLYFYFLKSNCQLNQNVI